MKKIMKRILITSLTAMLLTAALHAQAALTGKWQGATPNGSQLVLDLTATETTLKGTLTRDGTAFTLTEGKVSKSKFTFTAVLNDQPEAFTGELTGDEIKVWLDRRGPESAAVLKRVKK